MDFNYLRVGRSTSDYYSSSGSELDSDDFLEVSSSSSGSEIDQGIDHGFRMMPFQEPGQPWPGRENRLGSVHDYFAIIPNGDPWQGVAIRAVPDAPNARDMVDVNWTISEDDESLRTIKFHGGNLRCVPPGNDFYVFEIERPCDTWRRHANSYETNQFERGRFGCKNINRGFFPDYQLLLTLPVLRAYEQAAGIAPPFPAASAKRPYCACKRYTIMSTNHYPSSTDMKELQDLDLEEEEEVVSLKTVETYQDPIDNSKYGLEGSFPLYNRPVEFPRLIQGRGQRPSEFDEGKQREGGARRQNGLISGGHRRKETTKEDSYRIRAEFTSSRSQVLKVFEDEQMARFLLIPGFEYLANGGGGVDFKTDGRNDEKLKITIAAIMEENLTQAIHIITVELLQSAIKPSEGDVPIVTVKLNSSIPVQITVPERTDIATENALYAAGSPLAASVLYDEATGTPEAEESPATASGHRNPEVNKTDDELRTEWATNYDKPIEDQNWDINAPQAGGGPPPQAGGGPAIPPDRDSLPSPPSINLFNQEPNNVVANLFLAIDECVLNPPHIGGYCHWEYDYINCFLPDPEELHAPTVALAVSSALLYTAGASRWNGRSRRPSGASATDDQKQDASGH